MYWQQISSEVYERPLDTTERLFRDIAAGGIPLNREHFRISACIRLDGIHHSFEIIRQAWKKMRYDHPILAAVVKDNQLCYSVPINEEIETWLDQTCIMMHESISAKELYQTLTPEPLPTIYFLSKSSELLFRSSHWRIDGLGTILLLDNLVQAIYKPQEVSFGSEVKNLSPSLEQAINKSLLALPAAATEPTSYNFATPQRRSNMYLPFLDGQPKQPSRCETSVSEPPTACLIIACKRRGISVTSAIHAALIAVMLDNSSSAGGTEAAHYTSWCSFDLRSRLSSSTPVCRYPVALWMTGLPISVDPAGFHQTAVDLNTFYSQELDFSGTGLLRNIARHVEMARAALLTPPINEQREPAQADLSSLGDIDRFLRANTESVEKFRPRDFWLGIEVLTKEILIHCWTYQGKLRLSACYNTAFYTTSIVETLLKDTKELLLKKLEVTGFSEN